MTCPKAQLREQVPARRADLGRRVPTVDDDQLAPVPLALVRQLSAELAPAAAGDGTGETPVADHTCHVQVLDYDHVVLADQAGAGAVQKVGPSIADLAVRAGHLRRGPGSVRATLLATRHAPLVAGQPAGIPFQVPRVGNPLPIADDREVP